MEDNILTNTVGYKELEKMSSMAINLLDQLDKERAEYRTRDGYSSFKFNRLFEAGQYMTNLYRDFLNNLNTFNNIATGVNEAVKNKNIADAKMILEHLNIFLYKNTDIDLYRKRSRLKTYNQWLQIDVLCKKALVQRLDDMYKIYNTIEAWIKEQDRISERTLENEKRCASIRAKCTE